MITSEIFQLTNGYRDQFVGEVMTDILSIEEIIQRATLWIPKGIKNCNFYSIAFSINILVRDENIIFEEWRTKTV